jgi:hypothetical protein
MIKSSATVIKVTDDSGVVVRAGPGRDRPERRLFPSGAGVPPRGPGGRETDRFADLG